MLAADRVGARVGRLYLFDAANTVRAGLIGRFGGDARVVVLDETALAALPPASVDLIVVNSVLQYVPRADLDGLLAAWRRLLAPDGRLAIGDVAPPEATILDDARSLIATAARNGFLLAALSGLAATALSGYRRNRRALGLTRYGEAEMLEALAAAGLMGARRPANLGFNTKRMTFIARVRA